MPTKTWQTHLPDHQDNLPVDQPDLNNDSFPGAGDGDLTQASQAHALRDKVDYCATQIGSNLLETGSLRKRVGDVETGKANDSAVVHNTGNENVAGVKTFSSSPSVPTPTLSNDAANRNYVDTAVSSLSGNFAASVQTVVQLRAITAVNRADHQIRLVDDKGSLYRFASDGTGADDGDATIIPDDITFPAPGRWFKTSATTQNHESLTGLLGGGANDHQHLTTAQLNKLTGIETGADVTANHAPQAHAASHKSAGGDSIKLDELAAPTDVTTLNATTGQHGLLPKLGGGTTNFLRADGTWAAPPGGTDANAVHVNVGTEIHGVTLKASPLGADELLIEDSADSWAKKRIAISTLPSTPDTDAIHKSTASEIHGLTNKATPIGADEIVIEDSAASWAKKRVAISTLPTGSGDSDAIHKSVAGEIDGLTAKSTPVGADELVIEDSAASWAKKKIAISSLPSSGGVGGGDIATVLHQNTNYNTDVVVGAFTFDKTDFSTATTIKFKATGYVSVGTLTGTLTLYNLTDATSVVSLTFTSVTIGEQISADIKSSLPSSHKVYECRLKVTGGGGPGSGDLVLIEWAGLEIR